ncbi:hypothetical protein ACB092_01G171400 [Castanea dentata]
METSEEPEVAVDKGMPTITSSATPVAPVSAVPTAPTPAGLGSLPTVPSPFEVGSSFATVSDPASEAAAFFTRFN